MTRKQMTTLSLVGVLALSFALGACGRRGSLEQPSRGGSLEDAVIGYDAGPSGDVAKPDRPFILDGLI